LPEPIPEVSLLFDLFVTSNRIRRLVEVVLADAPLRGEEYAVYSLLFDHGPMTATAIRRALAMPLSTLLDHLRVMEERGHLRRKPHPRDGRAQQLSLTIEGTTQHRLTNAFWEPMHRALDEALPLPADQVRRSLRALDQAARSALMSSEEIASAG
jgi:DNA-binding MarR family transcriptional regulator